MDNNYVGAGPLRGLIVGLKDTFYFCKLNLFTSKHYLIRARLYPLLPETIPLPLK